MTGPRDLRDLSILQKLRGSGGPVREELMANAVLRVLPYTSRLRNEPNSVNVNLGGGRLCSYQPGPVPQCQGHFADLLHCQRHV